MNRTFLPSLPLSMFMDAPVRFKLAMTVPGQVKPPMPPTPAVAPRPPAQVAPTQPPNSVGSPPPGTPGPPALGPATSAPTTTTKAAADPLTLLARGVSNAGQRAFRGSLGTKPLKPLMAANNQATAAVAGFRQAQPPKDWANPAGGAKLKADALQSIAKGAPQPPPPPTPAAKSNMPKILAGGAAAIGGTAAGTHMLNKGDPAVSKDPGKVIGVRAFTEPGPGGRGTDRAGLVDDATQPASKPEGGLNLASMMPAISPEMQEFWNKYKTPITAGGGIAGAALLLDKLNYERRKRNKRLELGMV